MRKYIFPMVGMLAMAMIAPLPVSASSAANAQVAPFSVYEPSDSETTDGKLKPELMAGAQTIHVGDKVNVDFTVADYKVFKLTVNAGQAVRIKRAKNGEEQGYFSMNCYDAAGKSIGGEFLQSGKAATYYMLAYSKNPAISYFIVENAMFTDNIVNQDTDVEAYTFVPSVSGQYSWTVQSKQTSKPEVNIYECTTEDGDTYWNYLTPAEGQDGPKATVTLTAGKTYGIAVYTYGKYNLTLTKSAAADAVIAKINAIGTVTANSDAAIQAAKAAYNALSPAEKKLVYNAGTISTAEKRIADITRPSVKKVKVKAITGIKAKKATVAWKKVSGANGYEVKYATKKNFKKAKTVTVKATKGKVVIKKLKTNKKYYVKVRAYKMHRGQKYYGAFSKVKTFTAK